MTGTSFQHVKRGSMTEQRALRVFQMRGGRCGNPDLGEKDWGCGRKLKPGDDWHIEHGIALENGGSDEDDNLYVGCDWCKPTKDAADHALAGHGRRMSVRHSVPKRFKKSTWRR